jgi:hypothetical protein
MICRPTPRRHSAGSGPSGLEVRVRLGQAWRGLCTLSTRQHSANGLGSRGSPGTTQDVVDSAPRHDVRVVLASDGSCASDDR